MTHWLIWTFNLHSHTQGDEDDVDDEVDANVDTSQQKDNKTKTKKKDRLFTMTLVNAYGSSDFHPLVDDDKPLTLSSKCLSFALSCKLLIYMWKPEIQI